jgi:DNA-binding beta-propeller fold protein YncE
MSVQCVVSCEVATSAIITKSSGTVPDRLAKTLQDALLKHPMRTRHLPLLGALGLLAIASGCDAQATPLAAPTKPYLVVANQRSGVATIVDLASGRVSDVDLDAKPHEAVVSPNGGTVALTIPSEGFGSGRTIIVLDANTAAVQRRIDIGNYRNPHGVAFLNDTVAIVGTLGGTSALFVNVQNGRILRTVEGLPENPYIVKIATNGRAYVSSPHSSKVSEIDVITGTVTRTLSIPDDPAGIAVSADGKELYAAVWKENTGGGIAVIDLTTGTASARLPATQPRRITITSDGRHVVTSDRDNVRIIDRTSRQLRSVPLGANAGGSGVDCSPDSTRCYVALSQAGEVVEIDVASARVLRRFKTERGADGMAYVPR